MAEDAEAAPALARCALAAARAAVALLGDEHPKAVRAAAGRVLLGLGRLDCDAVWLMLLRAETLPGKVPALRPSPCQELLPAVQGLWPTGDAAGNGPRAHAPGEGYRARAARLRALIERESPAWHADVETESCVYG